MLVLILGAPAQLVVHGEETVPGEITGLLFDSGGSFLVSASDLGSITVRDALTGKHVRTWKTGFEWLLDICELPEQKLLITANPDGTIGFWKTDTWTFVKTAKAHHSWVTSLAVAPNRQRFASGGRDNRVLVWSASSQTVLLVLKGHKPWISGLAVSPDSKLLASGDELGVVRIWDLQTGLLLKELPSVRPGDAIRSLQFSLDGKYLYSGSVQTLRTVDVNSWRNKSVIDFHTNNINNSINDIIPWDKSGEQVIIGSSDGTMKLVDIISQKATTLSVAYSRFEVKRVALSLNRKTLAAGDSNDDVRLWQVSAIPELKE